MKNENLSMNQLNNDLEKISNWAHHWKMSFNRDPKKQAQEVIFSRNRVKDSSISCFQWHYSGTFDKSLGIQLDEKLDFNAHVKKD